MKLFKPLAVAAAAAIVPVTVLFAGPARLRPLEAVAALQGGEEASAPRVLARPLWAGLPAAAGTRTVTTMRIIRREQRHGVLRDVLGTRPARLVQLGALHDGGRPVGATALLALPVARRDVHGAGFKARVLRDVLVSVDLRRGAVVAVEPGPASRTSGPAAASSHPTPMVAAAAAPTTSALVRLSPHGPSFAPYDGTPALGSAGRDWPVSLVFAGHATVAKVKQALRAVGFTRMGERRWLAYGTPSGAVGFDGDRGLKTACDANGTDVHLRLYAPPATDHFSDPRFGSVVVATAHLDRGEGCGPPPRLFGFSEEAERRVADGVARHLGWRVQPNRLALRNAEPYRLDLAAPDHVWWSDGRATLIDVP